MEHVLARAYRGSWPGRLAHGFGMPGTVRSVFHEVRAARWPRGAPPIRVGFASDLHAGPTTDDRLLEEAVDALARSRPDLVLFGGDFVFLDASRIEALATRLGRIDAPLGRFAVLGNHDLWADDAAIVSALERNGIRVLVNETVALPAPYETVTITGLDDPWTGIAADGRALDDAGDVRIVLVHAPSALLRLDGARFDLMLCGHTHGGHVALPGGVPIVSVGPLSRRYPHGPHDVGRGRKLVVSRGVGATEMPFRLNADPDVRIVDLGRDPT